VTDGLELTYDPSVDAVQVVFLPERRFAYTEELDHRRAVDYDTDGRVAGIEFLHASEGMDLEGLPEPELLRDALSRLAVDQGWAWPSP